MMKLLKKNSTTGLILGFVIGMGICLSICSIDSQKIQQRLLKVQTVTTNPDVPEQVMFCGQPIDLTRYNRHESMDRELSTFTYYHSTTMLMFKRANRYFPIIEPILKANGIPDDFKYLAVIESHLDPRITSPARAVGTWQMMESTAREYGLTVNSTIDERCDIVKSTEAACKYLNDAYLKYGDWAMAAASYNAGMGRISSEKTKQDVNEILDLWLVEETSRYVYRILAIKQLFEAPYKYGFHLQSFDLYKPLMGEIVNVSEDITNLAAFAKEKGITYSDLKRYNPWLRNRNLVTGGKSYQLFIPDLQKMSYQHPNNYVHNQEWVKGEFSMNKLSF